MDRTATDQEAAHLEATQTAADLHPGDFLHVFRSADAPDAEFRAIVTDFTGRETFALTLMPSPSDSDLPTDEQPEYLTVYSVVRIERAVAAERER